MSTSKFVRCTMSFLLDGEVVRPHEVVEVTSQEALELVGSGRAVYAPAPESPDFPEASPPQAEPEPEPVPDLEPEQEGDDVPDEPAP